MNRTQRATIARETLEIIEAGGYNNRLGQNVALRQSIDHAVSQTQAYAPEDFDQLKSQVENTLAGLRFETDYFVDNATTFATAQNVLRRHADAKVFCLNFASAKNPGGGFLGGSKAQEEALARASALYPCINPHQTYYETNRNCGTCLYTDHMIYSPDVPVFRDDEDRLLDKPYVVSILTAPAVNTGAVANSNPDELADVQPVMMSRIEKLLSIAVQHGHRHLILGAWGCGVFRNDPVEVASWFGTHLRGKFARAFESISFGVLDFTRDQETYNAFANEFRNEVASPTQKADTNDLESTAPFKIGVVGFSRNKFDKEDARLKFRACLDRAIESLIQRSGLAREEILDRIEIVSGYTNMGVPKLAYEIADQLQIKTVGFSAAQAKRVRSGVYPVSKEIIVGKRFGDESEAFIQYIDTLIRIGGGPQSRKETEMFKVANSDQDLSQILFEEEVEWFGN